MLPRLVVACLVLSTTLARADHDSWENVVDNATRRYGLPGAAAAKFLAENHPPRDRKIDPAILDETIEYALRARDEFPWAGRLSRYQFHNDVLPYASLDESRCLWRKKLYDICRPIVADCTTASEAAHAINQKLFNAVNVHYNTDRSKTNQNPLEAIAESRATCTGLSILLVDACRSVGVPARIAGVANWRTKQGNHTWVEIWDDGWHFLGADEPDQRGLDHAWFTQDAMKATSDDPKFAVWATSFEKSDIHFPMAWNLEDTSVPGVDVTKRYLNPFKSADHGAQRFVRVWSRKDGERLWAIVNVVRPDGEVVQRFATRAGSTDLNDMPSFGVIPGDRRTLVIEHDGAVKTFDVAPTDDNIETLDLEWDQLAAPAQANARFSALSKGDAEALVARLAGQRAEKIATDRRSELDNAAIEYKTRSLRLLEKTFGDAPAEGRSLWISLHGGGGAPEEVNDQQWQNQIKLYEPEEGIYIAPRAPSNTWDLWHKEHIDHLLDRLIETYVAARNVNPNKVYLMGYSAGGDGVYQLAPRMADRFAAASMMAGHPNESQPLGLRNLPFAIFAGGEDEAFNRNRVAARWGKELDELHEKDPGGYTHRTTIYRGLGHWMNGRDKEALPWMAQFARNPWPNRIVWYQDDVTHDRFYWLRIRDEDAKQGTTLIASASGQTISIETEAVHAITLRLRDSLVDLDKPVKVLANGKLIFEGRVARTEAAIDTSLNERNDAPAAATAELPLTW
ncbi:MAG TPA: transglutaminase domain-containing protein [Phycisphaerae bacterium]|nr:transglutaminase domain-containing protein [Phycisphaerae bacterium]HRW55311.1 transglutaminase domain-containing protein [Phycisphaerae bacterium]